MLQLEQSTQYATLEEFRKMLAPVAGKALGEAVRHLTIEKRGVSGVSGRGVADTSANDLYGQHPDN